MLSLDFLPENGGTKMFDVKTPSSCLRVFPKSFRLQAVLLAGSQDLCRSCSLDEGVAIRSFQTNFSAEIALGYQISNPFI